MVVEKCPRTGSFCNPNIQGKCLECGFTQKELRKIRKSDKTKKLS